MPGVGQTISKLGAFFVYTLALSMSIFEKKSHPIRPVEGLILSAKVYTKKVPNFEIDWPTPGTLRPLTVKGVYLVSHSLV